MAAPPDPSASSPLAASDSLHLIQWHIDRYDRLRASTSARAAVLLSANAVLLTGAILLINSFLQGSGIAPVIAWPMRVLSIITVLLCAASINFCTNAVASWRTTRQLHSKEIPRRFVFNWGDTIRSVDGFSSFSTTMESLKITDIVNNATAELWTAILQHRRRHKYLRYGIHTFRVGAFSFLVVTTVLILSKP
jgi:hypothetical protein